MCDESWKEKKKEMKYTCVQAKFKEQKYVKFWVSEILDVNLLRLHDKFSSIVNSDKEYIFSNEEYSQEKLRENNFNNFDNLKKYILCIETACISNKYILVVRKWENLKIVQKKKNLSKFSLTKHFLKKRK